MTETTPNSGDDPVARDIESRDPNTDDAVAGEQVLADDPSAPEPHVAPEPDELAGREGTRHAEGSARSSDNT